MGTRAQSFWGLWEAPWNCPHQGTKKLAYFSTKSHLVVEADRAVVMLGI